METTKNLNSALTLLATAHTIKGTSFVGIDNYTNSQGEVSKQTLIAGITYENCLVNDFKALQENKKNVFDTLNKKYPIAIVEKAYNEIFESLEKRLSSEEVKEALRLENDATINRSDAQIDAYIRITKGVKLHKETEQLHIFGLVVRKTILEPIAYKKVNSRELTLCKNEIQKMCNFKQMKYRNFIFNKADVKLKGIEI